jgi:septal ring factor EnvC (AmiA/AmiB activator)
MTRKAISTLILAAIMALAIGPSSALAHDGPEDHSDWNHSRIERQAARLANLLGLLEDKTDRLGERLADIDARLADIDAQLAQPDLKSRLRARLLEQRENVEEQRARVAERREQILAEQGLVSAVRDGLLQVICNTPVIQDLFMQTCFGAE